MLWWTVFGMVALTIGMRVSLGIFEGYLAEDRTHLWLRSLHPDEDALLSSRRFSFSRGERLHVHVENKGPVVHRQRTVRFSISGLSRLGLLSFSATRHRTGRGRERAFFYSWWGSDLREAQGLFSSRAAQWERLCKERTLARISADGSGKVDVLFFKDTTFPESRHRLLDAVLAFVQAIDEEVSVLPRLSATQTKRGGLGPESGAPVSVGVLSQDG